MKNKMMTGVSVLSLSALLLTSQVVAQEAAAPKEDDTVVVVVGVRKSLQTAQKIKQNADTVVDSITAADIGAFPDKSVAEALQRVAGITVSRFAASGDTSHFSAEPSVVLVRGLNQVRSEFNGRDSFNANSSRGLSWGDVSPELMSGVDSYKNSTADMIEGGLAGTINLKTRVPFDQKGQLFAGGFEYAHGSVSNKSAPSYSALYSNRWSTPIGDVGLLFQYANSKVITGTEGIEIGRMLRVADSATGLANDGTDFTWNGVTSKVNYVPNGISIRENEYDRRRDGIAVAAQWQNPDKTMLATMQYNRSNYSNDWFEYATQFSVGDAQPLGAGHIESNSDRFRGPSALKFASDGVFQNGVLQSPGGWAAFQNGGGLTGTQKINAALPRTVNGVTAPLFKITDCYTPSWASATEHICDGRRGADAANETRWSDSESMTQDLSFNFKWSVTDRFRTQFDVQFVDATTTNYDVSVSNLSHALLNIDLSGKRGTITPQQSTVLNFPGTASDPAGLSNPMNYYTPWVMDHTEDSAGNELAVRLDGEYDLNWSIFDSVKFGVRRAEREQDVNWSTYNWGGINPLWSNPQDSAGKSARFWNGKSPWPADFLVGHNFSQDGLLKGVAPDLAYQYINVDYIKSQDVLNATFASPLNASWVPLNKRSGVDANGYLPVERLKVQENVSSVYLMTKFGGKDQISFNNMSLSGNFGVRYVETEVSSTGGTQFAELRTVFLPDGVTPAPVVNGTSLAFANAASAADKAFANKGFTLDKLSSVTSNVLPSLNLKLKVSDKLQFRFAISRNLSRADMGVYKNYTGMGIVNGPNNATPPPGFACRNASNAIVPCFVMGIIPPATTATNIPNPAAVNFTYNPVYTATTGNAAIKPVTSDNIDLTAEYYFAAVGNLTLNLFKKEFHDLIIQGQAASCNYDALGVATCQGQSVRDYTNNGVTRSVFVKRPINIDQDASLQGFEISGQRYFDFLPAPFNGFGIQANYTFIDSQMPNNFITPATGNGETGVPETFSGLPLEGLSEHQYNAIVMYEKGKWAGRLAYNWRSEYLVTIQDCCIKVPVWQDEYGQLDGSVRYKLTDNWELNLQGSNLLNAETVLTQQVDNTGRTEKRSWFRNDRRIQFGARFKY